MNHMSFSLKVSGVLLAAALSGCATTTPQTSMPPMTDVQTRTDKPVIDREKGEVLVRDYSPPAPPAPVARAAEPAPQPAAEPEPEPAGPKTVVVDEAPPPSAQPGECYTKLMYPAEYRIEQVQQIVKPAAERTEYTEPEYEWVEERVMVEPATKNYEIVPAEYGPVEERVLVREAYRREIEVPALYNTYSEQVLVTPARKVWKPGRGAVERVDEVTGEILCLVEEEAVYKTVERKELARAASKRYEDVPAEYATVTKTEMIKPETVREIEVPAKYETVRVRKMVKAPQEIKVPVPAEYAAVDKQVMVQPERTEWVQVLCDINTTPDKIMEVERALQTRGYETNVDGQIDEQLTQSIRAFQSANGLRSNGLMTANTLDKLGVPLR
jgi:hypothetical protein